MNMELLHPPTWRARACTYVCCRLCGRVRQQVEIGERGSSGGTGAALYVGMLIMTTGQTELVLGGSELSAPCSLPHDLSHSLSPINLITPPPFIPPSLHAVILMHFKQLLQQRSSTRSLIAQRGLKPSG